MRSAVLVGLGLVPSLGFAVEVGLFEGDWSLAKWSSPTRLREAYENPTTGAAYTTEDSRDDDVPAGMNLVDAWYSDPVRAQTQDFAISSTGQVTGDETGTVIGLSRNRLLYRGVDVLTTVFANPAGDILVESKREEDLQDLNIALKKPESLTLAELAGTWNLISLIQPDDLTTFGNLGDVIFQGESSVTKGQVQLNANGTFSGLFSGTLAIDGTNLLVSAGSDPITFRVNAGKNLAIATLEQDDEAEIVLLVRKPDALTTAQLAGNWRFNRMSIPSSLTEVFFNTVTEESREADSSGMAGDNEILVDLFHRDRFELERGNLRVQPNGSVADSAVTSMAVGPDQTAIVNADGETFEFFINSDFSILVGAFTDPDSQALIVLLKSEEEAAASNEAALDLLPIQAGGSFLLSWAGSTETRLEFATDGGGFAEIGSTLGQDAIEIDTATFPRAIFRLVDGPPAASN